MILSTDNSRTITAPGGDVVIKDAVVIKQEGVVVASMDARYDFSQLPVELHVLAARLLMSRRAVVALPARAPLEGVRHRKPRLPWWKRILS